MKFKIILILVFLSGILSCNNDDDTNDNSADCDLVTIINSEQFVNAPSDDVSINSLLINEDCLSINFSASGCNGETWVLRLIDSGAILESNPPQRTLRLTLNNEEDCEAFITRDLSFDISNLQVDGNQVRLNVLGVDSSILYEY